VERILGVDLTAPDMIASPSAGAYMRAAFDILATGIIKEDVAAQFLQNISGYYPGDAAATETSKDSTRATKGTP